MKANEFKTLRLMMNLSLTVASKKLRISKAYLSLVESGKRPMTPDLEKRMKTLVNRATESQRKKYINKKLDELIGDMQVGPLYVIQLLEERKIKTQIESPEKIFEKRLQDEFMKGDESLKAEFKSTLIKTLVDTYKQAVHTILALYVKCKMNELYIDSKSRRNYLSEDFWIINSELWPEHPATKINETIRYLDYILYSSIYHSSFLKEESSRLRDIVLPGSGVLSDPYILEVQSSELQLHEQWTMLDEEYPWAYLYWSFFNILKEQTKFKSDVRSDTLHYMATTILKLTYLREPEKVRSSTISMKLSGLSHKKLKKTLPYNLRGKGLEARTKKALRTLESIYTKVDSSKRFLDQVSLMLSKSPK